MLIKAIEKNLSEDDKRQLKRIFAPVEVGFPGVVEGNSTVVTRDGEIRLYEEVHKSAPFEKGEMSYLSSFDAGLSWKRHFDNIEGTLGRCVYIPELDEYMEIRSIEGEGTFFYRSKIGPDDKNFETIKISDDTYHIFRNIMYIPEKNRLISLTEKFIFEELAKYTVCFISDDLGKTWKIDFLKPLPFREITPPDKSVRWQNQSCEATFVRLKDDTLYSIFRTSYNHHYEYVSKDFGDTWSEPRRSIFHGTLTMPEIKRLSNGRLLFFWANNQPIPEDAIEDFFPTPIEYEANGANEIVFTNRDANHAAYSDDDGKTWHGFREVGLSFIRDRSDFRTYSKMNDHLDKSVHQFEAIELPYGKILLGYGQNISARFVIFDPKWLEEKERHEDFMFGIDNLSTQVFLKSVSGGDRGYPGHCAWNRTHGAVLMPDYDEEGKEVLFLTKLDDKRLYSDVQGAVWNFPASHKGTVTVRAKIDNDGLRISLADHWFHPIDVEVKNDAEISFKVTGEKVAMDKWVDIKVKWNQSSYSVYADDKLIEEGKTDTGKCGLSYVHVQSLETEFNKGSYIKFFDMKADE
ncbi:MAG: sialidase family protein [Clostridia bacterium]|nr:sialidase family protein [Clostridia bacterium]